VSQGPEPDVSTWRRLRLWMDQSGALVYLGEGARGPVTVGAEHSALVLGPPRSGKTTCIVCPSVALAPGPVVSASTKADVAWATSAWRAELGRCWRFDPAGAPATPGLAELRWSPVPGSASWEGACATAHAMADAARGAPAPSEASHWVERAEALLAPLLHAAALDGRDVSSVVGWVHRRSLEEPVRLLERGGAGLALDVACGIAATEARERSGIFSTAAGLLAAYRSEAALASASRPNFDPDRFVRSFDTVYVFSPASAQSRLAPLVAGLVGAVRDAAYRCWPASRRVLLALDEVANIAPLACLPQIVSEAGGQGLSVLACLQDLSQARARWGEAARGFLSLFWAKAVLPGIADLDTLELVSALAGRAPVRARQVSSARGGWRRTTTTYLHTAPRLPLDVASRGRPGHAVLIEGSQPSWLRLTPWRAGRP
jgi:type IV secretion system protein VirD4